MGLTAAAIFSFNLFCGLIPCEPRLKGPEIPPVDFAYGPHYNSTINLGVKTGTGWVEGYRMRTTEGRNIAAFEGIPYAEPPIGHYRFRSAVKKMPWDGVLHAKGVSPDCIQLSLPKLLRVVGSEDCLYLNIYKPDNSPTDSIRTFPVLVFFQGGSYYFGSSGDLGPAYLLNQDIILVTMNFRVGVLGFLSTGDAASPGNYGLKDQSLALQWIFENIQAFGGDPYRITLGGQSSGAAAAHLHMMSEQSRHYFQSGVSMSGSAFTHWAIKSTNESCRQTYSVAKHLKCPIGNNYELVRCLREKSGNVIVAAQFMLLEWIPFPVTMFGPVIELPGDPDAFIVETPEQFYFRPDSEKKPWIFSMTSQEGYLALMLMAPTLGLPRLRRHWDEVAPILLDYKYTAGESAHRITHKLSEFYFGPYQNVLTVRQEQITQLFGDRMFLPGVHKAIELNSQFAPTYAYLFDYKGSKYNVGNIVGFKSAEFGISHAEDLFYIFNSTTSYTGFQKEDKEEMELSQILTNLFTSFARTGEPFLTLDDGKVSQIWEPVVSTQIRFLSFNNQQIGMIPEPFLNRIRFWNDLSYSEKETLHLQ